MKLPLRRIFATSYVLGANKAARPMDHRRRRLRLMLRYKWLIATGTFFLVVALVVTSVYFASRPTLLRIAVGPPNSEDVRLVQAIGQQFVRDRATVRLRPLVKDNLAETAKAIDDREADLAVVRRDLAYPQTGQAIAVLREHVVVFIVPAPGSAARGGDKPAATRGARAARAAKKTEKPEKIEKIEDLAGKRIGVVGRGSPDSEVLDVVLKQYQVPPDKVTTVPLLAEDVAGSLRNNPVDVIFVAGPVTSHTITGAIAASSTDKEVAKLLPIGASEAIAARYPVYESTEIKSGVFGGHHALPEEDLETIAYKFYFVARRSLPENTAAEFTRLLFSVRQSLAAEYPAITKLEKPDTDKDAAVTAHPGAAAFIDDDQKTFFDRYSDFLYWGLMAMSGLGSLAAWLMSYAKADDRMKRLKVLERLLAIVKAARTAETLGQLDQLRAEADEILNRIIRQVEQADFDQSALMSFSLALDQAQRAIAERRAVLASPQEPARVEPASADVTPFRIAVKATE
jgi:hypothetical protein